ncbi:MAG: energy transducer TonB [Acidobacteriia bacterium]|nr:energy transducer TonB [Terriglobia bacterium]
MSNQQSPSYAARTPLRVSGRQHTCTQYAAPSQMSLRPRPEGSFGPDAIWGHYNNYRSNGLVGSAVIHAVVLGFILAGALFRHQVTEQIQPRETVTLIAPSPDSYTLPTAKQEVSGGGGGGDHDRLPAPKGKLPKFAMKQITPPAIVVRNEQPKLAVEPTVVVPPQLHLAANHMPNLGNPAVTPLPSAPPSNGTGSGGGIGTGTGGGVGVGHGPGVGPGTGGGIGGGVFKVGGGISAPRPLSTPDPQYTEEARNAKTQGTCILWLIVDTEGHPRDIRVVHGLGYGLESKAIEAVKQWRFEPAKKDGKPVNVQISVEVAFRLY